VNRAITPTPTLLAAAGQSASFRRYRRFRRAFVNAAPFNPMLTRNTEKMDIYQWDTGVRSMFIVK